MKIRHDNGSYTREYLDMIALQMIKEGKDIKIQLRDGDYWMDIKLFEMQMRFAKPYLFKDGN